MNNLSDLIEYKKRLLDKMIAKLEVPDYQWSDAEKKELEKTLRLSTREPNE